MQDARDIAIRTILGEALNEGPDGWAAVAHVLRNRAADSRWPSAIEDVALQPLQFSAWNTGEGGNDLVHKYGPETDPYKRVGLIYDAVMSGGIADPTGGATHYYAPAGMPGGRQPSWWDGVVSQSGADPVTIGGHIFAGRTNTLGFDLPPAAGPQEAPSQPLGFDGAASPGFNWAGLMDAMSEPQEQYGIAPPQIAPPPQGLLPIIRRDHAAPYRDFFKTL